MGELCPACLARQAHDVGQLAYRPRLPEPASLDLQDRRWLHHALGWGVAAVPGGRVPDPLGLQRHPGCQPAGLADHAGGLGALLRSGRGQDGRDPDQRHPRPARQQQLQGPVYWAKRVGYKEVHTGRMAINSEPRHDRPSCQQIGFCFQGCKSEAKWSTLNSEIPAALETGKLELRPESQVIQIQHDVAGKITGVLYAAKDGQQYVQKARVVCVAGNSIESPRLLLNSASSKFPDGLANSSGQVGRNYMRHVTGSVYAAFDKPVHMFRGTTMAGIIRDESGHRPERGFAGGYEMETLSLGLPFMAAFLDPGAWGREFAHKMEGYRNMAGMWIVGEDMPRETNRVTLHGTEKDKFGMPIPNVHFDDHPNDIAMRSHAYRQGTAVYKAAGARETYETPPYPSTHNLGTNRMSASARDGVVNKWGQTWDVKNLFVSDGSQFTTGASENPTLTIVTLAIRQAEYISDQMSKREI